MNYSSESNIAVTVCGLVR